MRDPSGAAIPGATVTLTRIETGVARSAPTDDRGEYRALSLEPGTYRVAAKAEGFAPQAREGFRLQGYLCIHQECLGLAIFLFQCFTLQLGPIQFQAGFVQLQAALFQRCQVDISKAQTIEKCRRL